MKNRTYKKRQVWWKWWARHCRVHDAGYQNFSIRLGIVKVRNKYKCTRFCWTAEEIQQSKQRQVELCLNRPSLFSPNLRVPRSLRHLLPKSTTWSLDSEWVACQNKRRQARKVSV